MPPGSRRDRFLWIAVVTVRKLREGPGPWCRAVKKGVYQLLPLSWQHRILRWTGRDEFFRRRDVRHAAADAGVEQPGRISVVLPVFNHADMVGAAIESVLAQTWPDLELIVLDDGSTDGVLDVLRRHRGDRRVRVLSQPNQGLPKALSTAFEFATGEFFTWTSADNVMLPNQLERLAGFLRTHTGVAMVYADYEVIDEHGRPLEGGEFRVMDRTDKRNLAAVRMKRATHDLNRYEDNFIGACFLYRGQVGRLLGDYNPEIGLEDYDYWMRINRLFRIEHLGTDEVLYRYRVHDNTLSARARELRILERAKALMGYERQRAAWCDAPLRVLADDATRQRIGRTIAAPDSLATFDGTWPRDDAKTLLALAPATLAHLPLDPPPPCVAIATWFETPEQVHLAAAQVRHLPMFAFAADADVSARLAVFTRRVFPGNDRETSFADAARAAANATFFRRTRDPERVRRAIPTPVDDGAPLRVLLQADTLGRGGLERVVTDLATAWRAAGVDVGVLVRDGSWSDEVPSDVERVRPTASDAGALRDLLHAGRWHVVSAHASAFGAAAAAAAGVPFVQTVHNAYVWFAREQIEQLRAADPHTAAYACVSASSLAYADLRLALDVRKMLVIENGIAPATPPAVARATLRRELGLADDDFVFLQVASLQPAKAHRVSLHALAAARTHAPHLKLVCVGSEMNPVHASILRGDAARLGLADAVVFAGHRDDMPSVYALADAFLLPSFWEGCSLAVWEAIRAGLPAVLSDVGAAREQLRHGRGVLVAPPFASTNELDASNVDAVVAALDPSFVARVGQAMIEVAAARTQPLTPVALPPVADRSTMAARHLLLFRWLLQGGSVAGVRTTIARAANGIPPARRLD